MVMQRVDAEDFLYMENRLLDRRELEAWLNLFTDDALYWLPMDEKADNSLEPSVLKDNKKTMAMRVHQLLHKPHYAQRPPSRTVHAVSNVIVAPGSRTDESHVSCNLLIAEMREGDYQQMGLGNQRLFAGHCEYRLRHESNGTKISMKKVILINRDTPIVNLSFIV